MARASITMAACQSSAATGTRSSLTPASTSGQRHHILGGCGHCKTLVKTRCKVARCLACRRLPHFSGGFLLLAAEQRAGGGRESGGGSKCTCRHEQQTRHFRCEEGAR
jgi:hypothetical protein